MDRGLLPGSPWPGGAGGSCKIDNSIGDSSEDKMAMVLAATITMSISTAATITLALLTAATLTLALLTAVPKTIPEDEVARKMEGVGK